MSTRSRIQDGTGTTGRAAVFDHRMRELEVQQSATNYISTSQLNGRTGIFTTSIFNPSFGTVSGFGYLLLSLTNNDPVNLMIIDRIYAQVTKSDVTLPNNNLIIALDTRIPTIAAKIINENKSSNIIPIVNAFSLITNTSGLIAGSNVPRISPTLGDPIELINPGSNAIILSGVSGKKSITVTFFNGISGTTVNLDIYVFIKFMMVPPDQLG